MSVSPGKFLDQLGLKATNPGSFAPSGWLDDADGARFTSINPATGAPIAEIIAATESNYDRIVEEAGDAFQAWRRIPAPRRGETHDGPWRAAVQAPQLVHGAPDHNAAP